MPRPLPALWRSPPVLPGGEAPAPGWYLRKLETPPPKDSWRDALDTNLPRL